MASLSHHDIIKLEEKELVAALKQMPVEDLELHAFHLMQDLGSDDYGAVMRTVMQALENHTEQSGQFDLIQNTLRNSLPNKAHMSDIYQRLASIIMLIIMRKYREILSAK